LNSLNLTIASRIYLLEPQWNPFLELQAIARAQRIGQTKQVVAIRYVMQSTIEQVTLATFSWYSSETYKFLERRIESSEEKDGTGRWWFQEAENAGLFGKSNDWWNEQELMNNSNISESMRLRCLEMNL
jgi:hypothetical protein